jgi:flagellar biosynthesis/type III secretory pathway protein FliH
VARDHLSDVEVRPCDQPDIGGRPAAGAILKPVREVPYESLDLVDLGHHLLLLAAQEKAESVVAEAGKEAQRLYEEAREAGRQEGREEAKQEVLPALVAFGHAGQSLIVFEERLVARYTPQIVRLAVEIAEKIIGHAVEAEPELVASVLERAKREVAEAKRIRIWLNPADHQILADHCPELIKIGCENGRTIEVVASEEVGRGGCRLETEMGLVDATLPTQIEEIRRQLSDEDPSESFGAYPSNNGRS